MKKYVIFILLLMLLSMLIAAYEINVILEVTGVKINGGTVYIAVYDSAEAIRNNQPCRSFSLEPSSSNIIVTTNLNEGYYRVDVFQDENNNGRLDTNFFGIPKEPIGISNYCVLRFI